MAVFFLYKYLHIIICILQEFDYICEILNGKHIIAKYYE